MTALLRLYPRAWRQRYEAEFLAMLEDRPPSLRDRIDILRGAIDARLNLQVRTAVASSVIRATPGDVFAFLANPVTMRIANPSLIAYEPDSIPMRVGTRCRVKGRMFGVTYSIEHVVTAWDEGRSAAMEVERCAGPGFGRATITVLFEPHDEGTRYTSSIEYRPNGLGSGLLTTIGAIFSRRVLRMEQDRLRRILEDGGGVFPTVAAGV